MIYRILVAEYGRPVWNEATGERDYPRELQGAGSCMGCTMDECGLVLPKITNRRTRFFFTELGWQRVGRFVASDARAQGRIVKVIRRKNPAPSQIVYRDDLQVALLPRRGRS